MECGGLGVSRDLGECSFTGRAGISLEDGAGRAWYVCVEGSLGDLPCKAPAPCLEDSVKICECCLGCTSPGLPHVRKSDCIAVA